MKKIFPSQDNSNIAINFSGFLKDSIYIIYGNTYGKKWIEYPKEMVPDLLFCDSKADIMDRSKFASELVQYENIEITPFIYLKTNIKINNMTVGIMMSADDYIIKPLNGNEWFKKIEERIEKDKEFGRSISRSFKKGRELAAVKNYDEDDRIFIDSKSGPKIIKIGDILFITSKGNDSIVNMTSSPNLNIRKTLNSWEEILPINIFRRINRSTIINLKYVESISRWNRESYIIRLKDIKDAFSVSYRYAREMRAEFK